MSKICLIYTGGTIGMVRRDGELRPPEDPADFLRVAPELKKIVEYEFVPIMNKDSTNVNHEDWAIMAQAVHDRLGQYDGFVVAHGTDTMHFSASAVAFALGPDLPCPVVFTGAQTIPEVAHGDARINLLRAAKVALEDFGEVAISFGDYIFRGPRAQKKNEAAFDAFESPAQFPLGYITEEIRMTSAARPRIPLVREAGATLKPELRSQFAGGVLQVSLIPGLRADLVAPAIAHDDCRGVILQSFGAGNVPHDEDNPSDPYSLISVIEKCVDMGKPVMVTSQFPANATLHSAYATGRRAVDAGAIPTSNMTGSCALAKFRWALAQAEGRPDSLAEVRRIMGKVYVDEMDESEGEEP